VRRRTGVSEPEAASASTTTVRHELDDGVGAARVERLRQPVRLQTSAVATSDRPVGGRHAHEVGRRRRTAARVSGGGGVERSGRGQVEQADDDATGRAQPAQAVTSTGVVGLRVAGRPDVAV